MRDDAHREALDCDRAQYLPYQVRIKFGQVCQNACHNGFQH